MFNKQDISRNTCQLTGAQARKGYDWWWHSFTGYDAQTGEARPFFIEFFLCNPALGGSDPVFGQIPGNKEKGIRPSYLMVKAGSWGEDAAQLHRFFGWEKIHVDMGCPFSIEAGDCRMGETFTEGSVCVGMDECIDHPEWMCQSGEMSWNLRISKKTAFNVGFGAGKIFRRLQLFEMFWHAEGMATAYEGYVMWNGRRYVVRPEDCYGYADKNWGKDFTSPWVWLSSCNLTSEITGRKLTDSVFDIGGGRPKCGPVVLDRKLLSAFWYEGRGYEFNFSKFWTFCRTRFDCRETDTQIIWHVDQRTWRSRMVTDITCEKKDMLLVNYEAPNGLKLHNRLWNGGNGKGTVLLYHKGRLIDRIHAENIGCEWGEYGMDVAEKM
ncbi:MAG: tocopherol cyclase family protein [Bacteroidales bacterium]|nr:tocopherol cyclase family protein [Bacteroidales bacterium]